MISNEFMDCGARIKIERQKRSWTQEQLAERARLSVRTIQRIECGAEAAFETLRLLAEALAVPPESLQSSPSRTHFNAPWSRLVKGLTFGSIGLTTALITLQAFFASPTLSLINYILFLGVLVPCMVLGVYGYSLRDGQLLVHRLGWATRFDLSDIQAFEANPHAMMGSLRLFGNGGLFCFIGLYRNGVLGRYSAYVTNHANAVVLVFRSRKIVISPDSPSEFLLSLQEKIKGVSKPPSV